MRVERALLPPGTMFFTCAWRRMGGSGCAGRLMDASQFEMGPAEQEAAAARRIRSACVSEHRPTNDASRLRASSSSH